MMDEDEDEDQDQDPGKQSTDTLEQYHMHTNA
jgi:hypothetical protein